MYPLVTLDLVPVVLEPGEELIDRRVVRLGPAVARVEVDVGRLGTIWLKARVEAEEGLDVCERRGGVDAALGGGEGLAGAGGGVGVGPV